MAALETAGEAKATAFKPTPQESFGVSVDVKPQKEAAPVTMANPSDGPAMLPEPAGGDKPKGRRIVSASSAKALGLPSFFLTTRARRSSFSIALSRFENRE